jgi:hypothetical protein
VFRLTAEHGKLVVEVRSKVAFMLRRRTGLGLLGAFPAYGSLAAGDPVYLQLQICTGPEGHHNVAEERQFDYLKTKPKYANQKGM